jgi:hypothetical protein
MANDTGANAPQNKADADAKAARDDLRRRLKPGARVRVTQQIAARDYTWTSDVRGTVVAYQQKQTGSWFAHSKDDKLWLDRLVVRKDDGELTTLILDDYSDVEVESTAGEGAAGTTEKKNESDLPV